jgi:glutathione S-transferase
MILGYWNIRGLAQPIRFLLEYLRLPYEDKRYTNPEQWFRIDKLSPGFIDNPLANLPYLKDGNKVNILE